MNTPKTRSAGIAAYCKQCIHDSAAFGTWREQVAVCPSTDCPLWRFRPAQDAASCPDWIKSHDPADLPERWARLEQAAAVRAMRADIAAKPNARVVRAGGRARGTGVMVQPTPAPRTS